MLSTTVTTLDHTKPAPTTTPITSFSLTPSLYPLPGVRPAHRRGVGRGLLPRRDHASDWVKGRRLPRLQSTSPSHQDLRRRVFGGSAIMRGPCVERIGTVAERLGSGGGGVKVKCVCVGVSFAALLLWVRGYVREGSLPVGYFSSICGCPIAA